MGAAKTITQERLKELIHYDPETGLFTWRMRSSGSVSAGSVAGYLTHGYREIRVDYKRYYAHRLAFLYMEGYIPEHQVDHINRIRDDNRWENLRHATYQCNRRNCSKRSDNKSGVTGVRCSENGQKWLPFITIDGKQISFGTFSTLKEAAQVRWEAEVKYDYPNCNTTSSAYQFLQRNT